jgi:hypothetical protein
MIKILQDSCHLYGMDYLLNYIKMLTGCFKAGFGKTIKRGVNLRKYVKILTGKSFIPMMKRGKAWANTFV